ncbi:EAL and HDOD domain-containing protein [Craterilacuibacter sp.]|uniref:EAL and HDOD domain-containing protein n=1 Tax=Craterilacuibacter sp. TaxID=2870909 RepID=UPI003F2D1D77
MLKTLFGSLTGKSAPAPRAPENTPLKRAEPERLPPAFGFVTHHPVYDSQQKLVAYEFVARDAVQRNEASAGLYQQYDNLMLNTLLNLDVFSLLAKRRAFINLSLGTLQNPQLATLAAQRVICVINPSTGESVGEPELEQIRQLKSQGLCFALEPTQFGDTHLSASLQDTLFGLMDYLVLDFSAPAEEVLIPFLDKLPARFPHARWYARNINSMEAYEVCLRSSAAHERFVLFHGPFITQVRKTELASTDASQLRVMEIMRMLRAGADSKALDTQFKLDSVLLFKLLRFINASANGLSRKVATLDEILLLLGRETLFKWLTLLLFNGTKEDNRSQVLLERSLWRARFMENLGVAGGKNKLECEHLFLTGMFSMLDALLQQPINEALQPLSLPATVSNALIDCQGLFAPYLALTLSLEQGQTDRIRMLSGVLGLQVEQINRMQLQAMTWAESIANPA